MFPCFSMGDSSHHLQDKFMFFDRTRKLPPRQNSLNLSLSLSPSTSAMFLSILQDTDQMVPAGRSQQLPGLDPY